VSERQLENKALVYIWCLAGICLMVVMLTINILVLGVEADASQEQFKLPVSLESAGDIVLGYFLVQSKVIFNFLENQSEQSKFKNAIFICVCIVLMVIFSLMIQAITNKNIFFLPNLNIWFQMCLGFFGGTLVEIVYRFYSELVSLRQRKDEEINSAHQDCRSYIAQKDIIPQYVVIILWNISVLIGLIIIGDVSLWLIQLANVNQDEQLVDPKNAFPLQMGTVMLSYLICQFRFILTLRTKATNPYVVRIINFGIFMAFILIGLLITAFSMIFIHSGAIKAGSIGLPPFFQAWVFSMLGFVFGLAGETMPDRSTEE